MVIDWGTKPIADASIIRHPDGTVSVRMPANTLADVLRDAVYYNSRMGREFHRREDPNTGDFCYQMSDACRTLADRVKP